MLEWLWAHMDDAPTEDGVHLVIAAAELAMLREMCEADSMPCERLGQCSTAALFNSGEDASFLDAPGAFSLAQRALAPRLLDTQDPT